MCNIFPTFCTKHKRQQWTNKMLICWEHFHKPHTSCQHQHHKKELYNLHTYKKRPESQFDSQQDFFHHLFGVTFLSVLSCYNSITLQIRHPESQPWYGYQTQQPPTSRGVLPLYRDFTLLFYTVLQRLCLINMSQLWNTLQTMRPIKLELNYSKVSWRESLLNIPHPQNMVNWFSSPHTVVW